MSQLAHYIIAIILWWITFHGFIKRHPIMREHIVSWQDCFNKILFGE